MSTNLSPYFAFNGNAREVLEFWQSCLGGELRVMTFGEGGMGDGDFPADNLMHGQLDVPAGYTIMAADSTKPGDEVVRGGVNMCFWGDDVETLRAAFDKLAEGGTVNMPLEKQMWGDFYGDLTDKFGINWGFNLSDPSAAQA